MTNTIELDRLVQWRHSIDSRLWGGGPVAYERSLEGRVSAVEDAMQAAHAFERATRNLQDGRGRLLARWVQVVLVASALVTAVASLIAAAYAIG